MPDEVFEVSIEHLDDDVGVLFLKLADGPGWAFVHGEEGRLCMRQEDWMLEQLGKRQEHPQTVAWSADAGAEESWPPGSPAATPPSACGLSFAESPAGSAVDLASRTPLEEPVPEDLVEAYPTIYETGGYMQTPTAALSPGDLQDSSPGAGARTPPAAMHLQELANEISSPLEHQPVLLELSKARQMVDEALNRDVWKDASPASCKSFAYMVRSPGPEYGSPDRHAEKAETTLGNDVIEALAAERRQMELECEARRNAEEQQAAAVARCAKELEAEARRQAQEEQARLSKQLMEQYERLVKSKDEELKAKEQQLNSKLQDLQHELEVRMAEKEEDLAKREAEVALDVQRFVQEKDEEYQRLLAEKAAELAAKESQLEAELARDLERQVCQKDAELQRRLEEANAELAVREAELETECQKQWHLAAELKNKADLELIRKLGAATLELTAHKEQAEQVKCVFSNLPPLQLAMETGDMGALDKELAKWNTSVGVDGDGGAVVQAVVNLARERLQAWKGVEVTFKEVLKEVEHLPTSDVELTRRCHKLFRALKDAQLTKMDLCKSCPQATERMYQVLLTWQERTMLQSNPVQKLIIRRIVTWPNLGPFDFPDLDVCLRLVDRCGNSGELFLNRARALVESDCTHPKEFRSLLQHLETMLFFLKHTKSECIMLTHREFKKQAHPLHPAAADCLAYAAKRYVPGAELVCVSKHDNLNDVTAVLEEIRKPSSARFDDPLRHFRDIFYHWALAMQQKFNVLALPHHTQMMCLLAFQRFLQMEPSQQTPHTLLAQVGTGEGKSMIVAALAIYVVVALGKKAHVVIDDETLLERDFWDFKRLFDTFEVNVRGTPGIKRHITAVLCVSEERAASNTENKACLAARVDPDADICYCEAKHVQSYYAGIARGKRNFDGYAEMVLIVDEVDALIIDQEPNEAFVYPNHELSQMATAVAEARARNDHAAIQAIEADAHPAAKRVVAEMASEWETGKGLQAHRDFVFSKEAHRFCALQSGRANPNIWSLALECRNFQDGMVKQIKFQERLFVMSRPRVFQKYHRIIGVTGSIGSGPEREFIQRTYKAAFFEVPPFLTTCRGCPFHEPLAARVGALRQPVYVEPTLQDQLRRIAEVALAARERVPVLVIGRDRGHVEEVLAHLRDAARSRGLGSAVEDIVRSLSRTLCEADPMQWKDNLNCATLPLGDRSGTAKTWRVSVTDPRGGRGTDYRVDDPDVDKEGGLLLIPALVPPTSREWTQFLGRTARQDRRGQFCAILCSDDYAAVSAKLGAPAPRTGGVDVVASILRWNEVELKERIQGSAALYNCGLRMNELCEEVFSRRTDLLENANTRERLVDVCQRMRWMTVKEIEAAFAQLPGFDPSRVVTQARDLGAPEKITARRLPNRRANASVAISGGMRLATSRTDRAVIFCLDRSCSMMSKDTGTAMSRFATCSACVQRILQNQVHDGDAVGIVGFGSRVETFAPLTVKATGRRSLEATLAALTPETAGGTCFFDAVAKSLKSLMLAGQRSKWIVCLTDGDDLGSCAENSRGQLVTKFLAERHLSDLNMIMITVGRLKSHNVQLINSWVGQVVAAGGVGKHVSEQDAAAIASAFDVVAECLAAEVGGATEC